MTNSAEGIVALRAAIALKLESSKSAIEGFVGCE